MGERTGSLCLRDPTEKEGPMNKRKTRRHGADWVRPVGGDAGWAAATGGDWGIRHWDVGESKELLGRGSNREM